MNESDFPVNFTEVLAKNGGRIGSLAASACVLEVATNTFHGRQIQSQQSFAAVG